MVNFTTSMVSSYPPISVSLPNPGVPPIAPLQAQDFLKQNQQDTSGNPDGSPKYPPTKVDPATPAKHPRALANVQTPIQSDLPSSGEDFLVPPVANDPYQLTSREEKNMDSRLFDEEISITLLQARARLFELETQNTGSLLDIFI